MKLKILFLLSLKILLCLLCLNPLNIKDNNYNSDYHLIIESINMDIYFEENSTLNEGLELHEISKNNGPMIISGHSGTGSLALFNDLEYLKKGMIIKVIHENMQKEYEIIDVISYEKFSKVNIPDDNSYLYLITCDKYDMQKQLIIDAKLANIIYF